MTTVNGFVHITCSNCNEPNWILESKFINIYKKKNYIFCNKGCEVSYVLRNTHLKINKTNNKIENDNKEITITGTIGTNSLFSVYK